jgi:hypothetical protein
MKAIKFNKVKNNQYFTFGGDIYKKVDNKAVSPFNNMEIYPVSHDECYLIEEIDDFKTLTPIYIDYQVNGDFVEISLGECIYGKLVKKGKLIHYKDEIFAYKFYEYIFIFTKKEYLNNEIKGYLKEYIDNNLILFI